MTHELRHFAALTAGYWALLLAHVVCGAAFDTPPWLPNITIPTVALGALLFAFHLENIARESRGLR